MALLSTAAAAAATVYGGPAAGMAVSQATSQLNKPKPKKMSIAPDAPESVTESSPVVTGSNPATEILNSSVSPSSPKMSTMSFSKTGMSKGVMLGIGGGAIAIILILILVMKKR